MRSSFINCWSMNEPGDFSLTVLRFTYRRIAKHWYRAFSVVIFGFGVLVEFGRTIKEPGNKSITADCWTCLGEDKNCPVCKGGGHLKVDIG